MAHPIVEQSCPFLDRAFEMARDALRNAEVPVGCVFVYQGAIIAEGRNDVNATKNATRHAELVAYERCQAWWRNRNVAGLASVSEPDQQLLDVMREVTCYVTVEPCIMCADALRQLGVHRIVFGCPNERFGGLGSVKHVYRDFGVTDAEIVSGVRSEEAISLLKQFYAGENPNAPEAHRKAKQRSI